MNPDEILSLPEPKTRAEAAALHAKIHGCAKAIFAKGDDATTDDLAAFDKLRTRGDAVKAFLESRPDAAAMKSWVDDGQAFLDTPRHPIGHPAARKAGEFRVTGIEQDGHVDVDPRKRDVVSEVGRSVLGAKAWDGMQDPTYAKAFYGEYLRKGERMSAAGYKALEVGLDDQGGYFAPPQTIQRIVGREPTPTRLGGMVDMISTSADAVQMMKLNYTANAADDPNGYVFTTGFRSSWGNETADATTAPQVNDANLFGMIRVPVYTNLITGRLTFQQTEDPGFDSQGWMETKFNETIDLLKDQMVLLGTGQGMPLGLVTAALGALPTGDPIPVITTGTTNVIGVDDILNISEDLPEQYDDNAKFIFSKTATNKALRKIKDANGRPIFIQGQADNGYAGGGANRRTLNGYETVWSQFMPAIATGNVPILFGDPKGYSLVNRIGFSIQVLREIEALKQRVVLMGRLRMGGSVIEPFRLRALKVA